MPNEADRMERLESKLDKLIEGVNKINAELLVLTDRYEREQPELKTKITQHDARLNELERWRSWMVGLAAGAGVFSGILSTALMKLIFN